MSRHLLPPKKKLSYVLVKNPYVLGHILGACQNVFSKNGILKMAHDLLQSPLFTVTGRVNGDGSHSVIVVIGVSQFEIEITDDGLWLHVKVRSPHGVEEPAFVEARFHRAELVLGDRMGPEEVAAHSDLRKVPAPLLIEFPAEQPALYADCEQNYNLEMRQDWGRFSINFQESSVMVTPYDAVGDQMRGWELWLNADGQDPMMRPHELG